MTFFVGFTFLMNRLLKQGLEGLEWLRNNLSVYFNDLISLINGMVSSY